VLALRSDRALTFQVRVDIPTGDETKGLGTGHTSVEPGLLFHQAIGARGALASQIAFWHPFNGSDGVASAEDADPDDFAGDILFYGIGPSYVLYDSERIRIGPVLELAGWHVLGGYQTVWISPTRIADPVDGINIINLKLGVRAVMGARNSVYVGYGRALTDDVWYRDIVRLEYRFVPSAW
jgi:hypothetical protein